MRRIDLINSVAKIQHAFKVSGLDATIYGLRNPEPEAALASLKAYSNYASLFNVTDKKVLRTFNLHLIDEPKIWLKLISAEAAKDNILVRVRRGLTFFNDFLPPLVNLLKQDNIDYTIKDGVTEKTSNLTDKSLLTVLLPEDEKTVSNPDRLIKILESIELMYKVFSEIQKTSNSGLTVAAVDSGSDKSFDFAGLAQTMTAIKDFCLELWDRIVFFREKQLEERLEIISKALPILDKIQQMQDAGTLEREEAGQLKINITKAAQNFMSAGAVLPEFQDYSTQNPRKLMAPEQRLLENVKQDSGDTVAVKTETQPASDVGTEQPYEEKSQLSPDEEKTLLELLEKKNKKPDSQD